MIFAYACCRKTDFSYNWLPLSQSHLWSGLEYPGEWQQLSRARALPPQERSVSRGSKGGIAPSIWGERAPMTVLGASANLQNRVATLERKLSSFSWEVG